MLFGYFWWWLRFVLVWILIGIGIVMIFFGVFDYYFLFFEGIFVLFSLFNFGWLEWVGLIVIGIGVIFVIVIVSVV